MRDHRIRYVGPDRPGYGPPLRERLEEAALWITFVPAFALLLLVGGALTLAANVWAWVRRRLRTVADALGVVAAYLGLLAVGDALVAVVGAP